VDGRRGRDAGAGSDVAALPGQLNVDELLELAAGDEATPTRAGVRGELVSPADEPVAAFAATLGLPIATAQICTFSVRRGSRARSQAEHRRELARSC
jgi:hypothetical protein